MTGATTPRGDEMAGGAGRLRRLAAVTAVGALLLAVAALAAVCAPAASAGPRPTDADDGYRPAHLDAGRDVLLSSPVARVVRGALASGHQQPDGDDHGVNDNGPADPPHHLALARAAVDASSGGATLVERCSVALALSARTASAARSTCLRAAASRAPPLVG